MAASTEPSVLISANPAQLDTCAIRSRPSWFPTHEDGTRSDCCPLQKLIRYCRPSAQYCTCLIESQRIPAGGIRGEGGSIHKTLGACTKWYGCGMVVATPVLSPIGVIDWREAE